MVNYSWTKVSVSRIKESCIATCFLYTGWVFLTARVAVCLVYKGVDTGGALGA